MYYLFLTILKNRLDIIIYYIQILDQCVPTKPIILS